MPRLTEHIQTSLPPADAFRFVADFANASRWDPGVAWSERLDDGPLAVGSRFRLGVRMAGRVAPMDYRITHLETPHRVVLEGQGSGVDAVDDIRFAADGGGTRIEYVADIRFRGLLRLATPFAGPAFTRLARNARDGMEQALDDLAAGRSPETLVAPSVRRPA
jgi:carbon monoxide dehydrogenase subunit G